MTGLNSIGAISSFVRATFSIGLATVCALVAAVSARADEAELFEQKIRPLLQDYCIDCHEPDNTKGDLDIARFETHDMVVDSIAVWERIGKRIESGEMPPRSKKLQPTPEERQQILDWIATLKPDKADCDQIASEETQNWYPGYVMSRRLNREEYENTVRDLFGIQLDVAQLFPADGAGGEGFDNNGNALFLSSIQIEKYLEAADYVIETILPRSAHNPMAGFGVLFAERGAPLPCEGPVGDACEKLIIARPSIDLSPRAAAAVVLTAFLERAWRRPVDPAELVKHLTLFERGLARGEGYEGALRLPLKAALLSPHFLFLAEPQPEAKGDYTLGDFELATKLSYFIWASMPDEELFAVARTGDLNNPDELRRQVHRMLKDPKARALGEQFAGQWLGITQIGIIAKPDPQRFPEFDATLAADMREEAIRYFTHVVGEDRPLIELIDSNYSFANERLAKIYGLANVSGPDMQMVTFADANRGGVLGMPAVLTATSHALRTSPVLRGKWVLEQLLGDVVPPPPPGAGVLPEDDVQPDGLSFRARMEAHRTNPDCAGCHSRMDPIGFGLENFDPIGRWRSEQAGAPIDASGVLPSGETFSGPTELKRILLARKDDFARHLTRKMLGYALGRSLTQFDDCVVDKCMTALQANEYRASNLVIEIVLSHAFRHRYSNTNA